MAEAAVEAPVPEAIPLKIKRPIKDAIEKRVDLITAYYDPLPPTVSPAMKKIRAACGEAAQKIHEAVKEAGDYDVGRVIHAMDLLQQVKNCAVDGIIMPHAYKEIDNPALLEQQKQPEAV